VIFAATLAQSIRKILHESFTDGAQLLLLGSMAIGLATGDASVNSAAPILVGTAEILSNMALRRSRVGSPPALPAADHRGRVWEPSQGSHHGVPADFVVMDEFHYYGDRERGIAWQIPLCVLKQATFLLMSATLGDTTRIEEKLAGFTGREVASIRGAIRPVPLEFEKAMTRAVSPEEAPVLWADDEPTVAVRSPR